jgi:GNAT superfamily N-acetyltransferase
MEPLDIESARRFADALPDDPFTVEARCYLLRGAACVWIQGGTTAYRAAVVQDRWQPNEPRAFGDDPVAIRELLSSVPGWDCVNCSRSVAPALRVELSRSLGLSSEVLEDVYYLLDAPPLPLRDARVRRLSEEDLELVESAPPELWPTGYDSILAALSGGIVAGAIESGQLVATVSMNASSESYGNFSAYTLPPWRNQGFAATAACLVASEAQHRDLQPVWSTGETNRASREVARKVGFIEFGRRVYIVVSELRRDRVHRRGG